MVRRAYAPPAPYGESERPSRALTVRAPRGLYQRLADTQPAFTPVLLDADRIQAMLARDRKRTAEPSKAVVEKFNRLKAQWIKEQATSSRLKNVVLSIPYQNIIGMGKDALPLLLREIRTSPYYWFWALERITEANPAVDATTHEEMVSAWLEWARTNA